MTDSPDLLTADLADDGDRELRSVVTQMRSFGGRRRVFGRVQTLQVHEDNTLIREQLGTPGEGRVLVVDAGASLRRAVVGGNLGVLAARNGWAGILVAGAVRDTVELGQADVHVKALGSQPVPTVKRGFGVLGEPIRFLEVDVRPGDWVVSDEDGVVFLSVDPRFEG
ncbi:ribonuclease E activity regulator RraA [Pseudoclavibacter sp. CFCC 14310]|uniref:ribonuclease E activity regulator RraA n=1 Tax=Pseudoclavibacter sp. CFCC 14310 TaxID=2615180 RepID=UPI001301926B|nr:ribonuclease E activity regulator RraA [Pseudoclavibacter sp. CFCC 14310]KAB1646502.1 ribonuclease E activity regulator RraA [Pseudoclavibacter sp. CFCC 14310]